MVELVVVGHGNCESGLTNFAEKNDIEEDSVTHDCAAEGDKLTTHAP